MRVALLTQSSRYIRRNRRTFKASCFACKQVVLQSEDVAQLWRDFQASCKVIAIRQHKFWVCADCYERYGGPDGTLACAAFNGYNWREFRDG